MKDSVLNILESYLVWERKKIEIKYDNLSQNCKDGLRLKYDNDAKYYYEIVGLPKDKALYADTIISFWTPYRRLLELEAGWIAYKTSKSLECLIRQIKNYRNEAIRKINANIAEFAQICYSKGNYILLPERQMNNERYQFTEDRIDLTLYESFRNGKLAHFFHDDEKLKEWIDNQNLSMVFKEKEKNRDKIIWFISNENRKGISEMSVDEVYEYLKNATLLIRERNI